MGKQTIRLFPLFSFSFRPALPHRARQHTTPATIHIYRPFIYMPSIPILDTAGHGNHRMHATPHTTRTRIRSAQTFRIPSGDSRTRRHRIPPHPQHTPTQRQRYIRAGTPDISRRKPATIPGHAPLASPHKHDRQHPPDTTESVTESYRKKTQGSPHHAGI